MEGLEKYEVLKEFVVAYYGDTDEPTEEMVEKAKKALVKAGCDLRTMRHACCYDYHRMGLIVGEPMFKHTWNAYLLGEKING